MSSVPAGSERFGRSGAASGDAQIESLRLPPHSVEAEQAVLGGLLLSNAAWDRIGDIVSESDFYRADHRLLWRAITRLVEENKPADVLTVTEALKISGELQDAGGLVLRPPARRGHAQRGQHPPLRRDRPRARHHAQAGRGRHGHRRFRLFAPGARGAPAPRRGRDQDPRDRGVGRALLGELRQDVRRARRGDEPAGRAAPQSRLGDRQGHGLRRPGRDDHGAAGRGSHHHRRQAVDGEDEPRAEHRRARRPWS